MADHKGTIITTLLVAVLGAAVTLFIHFDNKKSKDISGTNTEKNEGVVIKKDSDGKVLPTPSLSISEVFVTPIDTDISSSFYLEVKNIGSAAAENMYIRVNFGESSPESCEVTPFQHNEKNILSKGSIQKFIISDLGKNESVYLSCLINLPYFKSISVAGGNVQYEKSLSFESYKEQRTGEKVSFYEGLLRALMVGVLVLILFRFLRFALE